MAGGGQNLKIVIFATLSLMTLTLTSDDIESHIIVNVSSTLINTTICFVVALFFIVDVRTYVRTDVRVMCVMYVRTCTDGRTDGRTDIFTGMT